MNVIIGAGPYGLSIATHLRARRREVRVFGVPMGTWREQMPEGMLLKSTPSASSLSAPSAGSTLRDYCQLHGIPPLQGDDIVSRDLFVRYALWFAERNVPDIEDEQVARVERAGDEYDVTLSNGETLRANNVVVAAGLTHFAYVPPELLALTDGAPSPDGPCSHSSQHRDVAPLANGRVAVVGSGQSALELATLIGEAGGNPVVIARTPHLHWGAPPDGSRHRFDPRRKPASPLGPGYAHRALSSGAGFVRYLPLSTRLSLVRNVLGPAGAWWLRGRYEEVGIETLTGRRVRDAMLDAEGVTLHVVAIDGSEEKLHVDHVVAATGYRVDLRRLGFLDTALRTRLRQRVGAPMLRPTFESSANGLYFAGQAAAPTFGPLMRFVAGTRFAATRVTEGITRGPSRSRTRAAA